MSVKLRKEELSANDSLKLYKEWDESENRRDPTKHKPISSIRTPPSHHDWEAIGAKTRQNDWFSILSVFLTVHRTKEKLTTKSSKLTRIHN